MKLTITTFTALMLLAGCIWASPPPETPDEPVFDDSFESGTLDQWSKNEGGPKIVWEPSHVQRFVVVGDRVLARPELLVREDIPATVLELTPSLDELVAIRQVSLPALSAGTRVSVELTLTAASLDEKGGTLKLRAADGPPRVYSKPLPINITGTNDIEDTLPPAEPEGKVEFTDSDQDGVPDDAQRAIELSGHTRLEKEVLLQYARVAKMQFEPENFEEAYAAMVRTRGCISSFFSTGVGNGTFLDARKPVLLALQGGLAERALAYIEYNQQLPQLGEAYRATGQVSRDEVLNAVFLGTAESYCEFNPEILQ